MTELEMLTACLERQDELDGTSVEAFWAWVDMLQNKRIVELSPKRREWLDKICAKLSIDPGSANLVSSKKVRVTEEERASLRSFHESLGPKPLRPPGR